MSYDLDDTVWVPHVQWEAIQETCPDCLGTRKWHCVLPSGEEFDVQCPRCYHGGYEPSNGVVSERWSYQAHAKQVVIVGVERRPDGTLEYRTTDGTYTDGRIGESRDGAKALAIMEAEQHRVAKEAHDLAQGLRKGRSTKSAADGDSAVGSLGYARELIRRSIKEMLRWVDYAARHGSHIDYQSMIEKEAKP